MSESGAFLIAGAGELTGDHRYKVSRDGDAWVATGQTHDGLRIIKRVQSSGDPHVLDIVVRFENNSTRSLRDLWVGMADKADGEKADRFANVIRPLAYVNEDIERIDDLDDLQDAEYERFSGPVDWFGMGNKYFMSVLLPEDTSGGEWVIDRLKDDRIGSFMRLTQPLDAGANREVRFRGYFGPKDIDITTPVGNNLEASVEFGIFGLFAKILLVMLKFFHGLVGNWGVAIILLTMSIKAVFFPLMQKQFVSSKRMQAIQPQLKELKEKYKDNQQLQTQMTMQLFKENNVNPMSGCLPMIIQMPVWFALYNVMLYSVEIYGTQFLYLKDLTEADPTGALPLLVTVLMVLQQKLMPMGSMDPMQQKMMRLMPVMFGIFMFTFPSGLVLYFSVNNVLTIAQQWFIYRKRDDESPSSEAS
jgi:YidC/Oxa1 family membrane protein insertase